MKKFGLKTSQDDTNVEYCTKDKRGLKLLGIIRGQKGFVEEGDNLGDWVFNGCGIGDSYDEDGDEMESLEQVIQGFFQKSRKIKLDFESDIEIDSDRIDPLDNIWRVIDQNIDLINQKIDTKILGKNEIFNPIKSLIYILKELPLHRNIDLGLKCFNKYSNLSQKTPKFCSNCSLQFTDFPSYLHHISTQVCKENKNDETVLKKILLEIKEIQDTCQKKISIIKMEYQLLKKKLNKKNFINNNKFFSKEGTNIHKKISTFLFESVQRSSFQNSRASGTRANPHKIPQHKKKRLSYQLMGTKDTTQIFKKTFLQNLGRDSGSPIALNKGSKYYSTLLLFYCTLTLRLSYRYEVF